MTISSLGTKVSLSGNGSNNTFAYNFFVVAESDLEVIIRSSNGTETVKSLTTHYTVSGLGSNSGGSITFTSGNTPTDTETVVIRRNTSKTQSTDYVANDPFPAESHEAALDKSMLINQELQEQVDRSIKISRTNSMTSTDFTVGATDRANKILAFDSSGEISVTQELGTFKGNWGASTAYNQRDIVKDTSTNNIFLVNTAHTSSGSQPLTTNANSAKYDLIVDAASATTSATNAASSATAAATSATNAATSASTATTKASEASTSATSAASSFDSFDDRYLGAKSSEPSTDNDGDALITGALFFDTTAGATKVWTGSAWQTVTVSATNQTNINTVAGIQANVTTVAGIASNVTSVAGVSSDVTTVAGIASNVTAVAGDATDIGNVAGSISNVNTVAGSISNVNTVAGANSNISTVAGAVTNINTVATNVAGVNSFADRYRVASSDPSSSLDAGDLAFNTTSNLLKFYDGSAWQTITADTDVKTKVSANDTTAGFLNGKLVAGSNISFTEGSDGGNETLTIAATAGATLDDATALAIALG